MKAAWHFIMHKNGRMRLAVFLLALWPTVLLAQFPGPSPTPIPTPPPPPPTLPFVSISTVGNGDAVAGGEAAKVIIRRVDGDTTNELVVRYKVAGAEAGVDYKQLPDSVILPAGVMQAKIKLKAIKSANGTRTAEVKLLASLDGAYIVGFPAVAKVKIVEGQ